MGLQHFRWCESLGMLKKHLQTFAKNFLFDHINSTVLPYFANFPAYFKEPNPTVVKDLPQMRGPSVG